MSKLKKIAHLRQKYDRRASETPEKQEELLPASVQHAVQPLETDIAELFSETPQEVASQAHTAFDWQGSYVRSDAPAGVLMIENYLPKEACQYLVEYANTQSSSDLEVVDADNSTQTHIATKKDEGRITQHVHVDGAICLILNIFNDIYCNHVANFYNQKIEWYERPQILRYNVGGKYNQHADSEQWYGNDVWKKVHDRDYSVLLYLNDEYEGGEIAFINQDVKIKPSKGLMLAFPSDHRFLHAALPTTSGVRYAMVSWASAMGVQKLRPQPPYAAIYLRQS